MNPNLIAFSLEMLLSIAISALVLMLLQPVLKDILRELCRRESRAAFWNTFIRLMIFIAPLLVVILFTRSTGPQAIFLAGAVRDTLLHALFGQFIGLLIIGKVLLDFSRNADKSLEVIPYIGDVASTPGRGQ
jgi:hypothetical protein